MKGTSRDPIEFLIICMGSLDSCPFCHLTLPPSELQRHANSHFEDGDVDDHGTGKDIFARDLELAQQLSLDISSIHEDDINSQISFLTGSHFQEDDLDHDGKGKDKQFAKDLELAQLLSLDSSLILEDGINCQISYLIGSQIRSSLYHVNYNGGLMALLRKCLEIEAKHGYMAANSTTLLCGYVDHFQSMPSEDVGWGCGWRNIQMLSSHLLFGRPEAREVLFGGCGFVPDIPFLQRWLEIAWERGFDTFGSHHFNQSIYGSRHRIGTTECAALFRSFGLRARIIDFGPKELKSLLLSVPGTSLGSQDRPACARGKRKAFPIYGPMDKYVTSTNHEVSQPGSFVDDKPECSNRHLACGTDHAKASKVSRNGDDHRVLLHWVWNYFAGESLCPSAGLQRVVVTNKAPLYFQHDGHSRTIVGIQVRHQKNDNPQLDLLILDPGHRTALLERSLKEDAGWKKLVKRGLHTLKKPQYQLCYIDQGIANGQEMEELKTMDSVFIEF